ncbi:MAG: PVC-type heme-binding CxxCH protein [Planctomycetota bacterium]
MFPGDILCPSASSEDRTVVFIRTLLALLAVCVTAGISNARMPADDPFALGVRNTEPMSAAEQLTTFTVPEGFAVQLVAAEPEIAKPMNLAFDVRGRMWVSSSLEYPFAAKPDVEPRDTIRILEDTNGDAKADRVTVFADKLNIPIGLLPYGDGVITFSIPNIWYLRDTDGDHVCDKREVLYGPFDTSRDTHGMCNAFRMGDDGWIYACHGFNNRSEVAGKDGHKVSLQSGNTFRFRPDGSRIELYTQGQVNPFGMSIDHYGDIYTADCHTKPVTLLLPGGCYDSFGRPHDGLGYVPSVMEHLHGSTAIAALELGQHLKFPKEYADSTFDGNVMTSRINRNSLKRMGSTVKAVEQPDFMSSTDPWFRPVDLVAGPDGALYVADFYNRIIGHYEVDLLHPGRDRFRGRIWRISHSASDKAVMGPGGYGLDLTMLSTNSLLDVIRDAPEMQKRLARDVIAGDASETVRVALSAACTNADPVVRQYAMRLQARRRTIDGGLLKTAAMDSDETVRVHAMRIVREQPDKVIHRGLLNAILIRGFGDSSPMVRRAATAAAAVQVSEELLAPLLRLLQTTDLADGHLRHSTRIALRNHLLNDDWLQRLGAQSSLAMDKLALADLCLAIKTPAAAEYVAANIEFLGASQPQKLADYLQFAAAMVKPEAADSIVSAVRKRFAGDLAVQQNLLTSMRQGFAQRHLPVPDSVSTWAAEVALALLRMKSAEDFAALGLAPSLVWSYVPHPDSPDPVNCWGVTNSRKSSDGVNGAALFSSFEAGEARTGIYRSSPFEPGPSLSFFIAGHDGFPDKPQKKANLVRLVDRSSGEVLREASPLRNDVAQLVEWNTGDLAGRRTVVELVDGDHATAYAWIAVGRFSDERLNPSDDDLRRIAAVNLIGDFQLKSLDRVLGHLMTDSAVPRTSQIAIAAAFAKIHPGSLIATASIIPTITGVPDSLITSAMKSLAAGDTALTQEAIEGAFRTATSAEQLRLAEQLASDQPGAEEFLRLMETGQASARLLLRPTIQQRLAAIGTDAMTERIDALRDKLPNEDAIVEELLKHRKSLMVQEAGDLANGRELFKKHCTVCHQIAGEGKQIGPNLDGIGNRGLDRVLEDVLAPNRNVDVAFRTTTVVTRDGQAISGLLKELEGNRVSMVDSQGRESILVSAEIDERLPSALSPMPANMAEILNENQFRDLISYLLSQRQVTEPKP